MTKALLDKLYCDPVFTALVRLIGYSGISLTDAQAQADTLVKNVAAKLPGVPEKEIKKRLMNATYDITRMDKRTNEDRYELTEEVRGYSRGLLGPDPERKLYLFMKFGPSDIIGEKDALAWEERYKKEQEEKAKQEAEEQTEEKPKKRARKGRSR